MLYVETVNVNSDLVRDYFTVLLDAVAYGLPGNVTANGTNSTTIAECLAYLTVNAGTFVHLTNINPGSGYNRAPMVRVYDSLTAGADQVDIILNMGETPTGTFTIGETVEQNDTGARGIVRSANSSQMILDRLSVLAQFIGTSNVTTQVVGVDSGAVANIQTVDYVYHSAAVGLNADVTGNVGADVGAINGIDVADSGFGYKQGQLILLKGAEEAIGAAQVNLGGPGHGLGYYRQKGGFLSDQKKLYDGYYYQEFSYEIQSALTLDKYRDLMNNVMHFAGSKMFGAYVHQAAIPVELTGESVEVEIS